MTTLATPEKRETILAIFFAPRPIHIPTNRDSNTGQTDIRTDALRERIYSKLQWHANQVKQLAQRTLGLNPSQMELQRHVMLKDDNGQLYMLLAYVGDKEVPEEQINALGLHYKGFHQCIFAKPSNTPDMFDQDVINLPLHIEADIKEQARIALAERGERSDMHCVVSIGNVTEKADGKLAPKPAIDNFKPIDRIEKGIRDGLIISKHRLFIKTLSNNTMEVEFDPRSVDRALGNGLLEGQVYEFKLHEFRRGNNKQAFLLQSFRLADETYCLSPN